MKPISCLFFFFFLIGLHVHCDHLSGHHDDQENDGNSTEHQHPPLAEEQGNKTTKCHKIAPSNADFAFTLYRQIASDGAGKNVFLSPLSISTAFAMLSLGAKSETQTQIHKGLAFNLSEFEDKEIHEGFHHLIHMLNRPNNKAKVNIGNALFIEESLKLQPKFLEDAKTLYDSEGFSSNFQNTAVAEKQINDYVENKTHGKITHVVQNLDPNTLMVLVNYIFFKAFWENPFNTQSIREEDFFVNANTTVKVNMMFQRNYYKFLHDDNLNCSVVEIPYKGDASALFILPDEGKMQHVEAGLVKEHLSKWEKTFKYAEVRLYIPKFSLSTSYDVKDLLQRLGVTHVFGHDADLSGIVEEGKLVVTKAIHKAVVDVHETGTEAAAVTVMTMVGVSAFTSPPPVFRFNRPFLFLICDKKTYSILFFGKVMNPTEK
ncbi:alpha-1-antiproteinase-like [Sceloporus undulatus]|uniref:alpha-1-antiproteinase-like n=1 Tax=Sceloporus undulatus TaxID=8520 RepID=UPI001C4BD17C|nr:alpha-1-antiproteinase-like [Sceloporus undulatus]XP_042310766.1 alpha-1-antiproteinase-like [Sceloporus undulatus]XP_042310774.1 alpha-1-antiproteinase-like [Sceloporus undulatus]XP_042310782.1 alpha-1-antiproteinase-like [Sceloporus undulatus]